MSSVTFAVPTADTSSMEQERSPEECWQLALTLDSRIRAYAQKVTRWGLSDYDDVVQDGRLGAWKAACNWNPEIASYSTHAWDRIRGEVMDGLRARDIVRRRSSWDPDDPRIQAQHSLNYPIDDHGHELGDLIRDTHSPGPEEQIVDQAYFDWQVLQADWAMKRLDPQERDVLMLYYWGDLTLWQIGEQMQFTESRACQILNKGLRRLEGFMVARDELLAG